MVPNSENPKLIISLFETVKLSVLISLRNFYIPLKNIKEMMIYIYRGSYLNGHLI